jgi:hypothetical protein
MDIDDIVRVTAETNGASVDFRDIAIRPMRPETAMLSLQALFSAIRLLLGAGTVDQQEAGVVLGLAIVGEHLSDQLTDRI